MHRAGLFSLKAETWVDYTVEQVCRRYIIELQNEPRILAIWDNESREAASTSAGWYSSDFFAFYHMFHGLT